METPWRIYASAIYTCTCTNAMYTRDFSAVTHSLQPAILYILTLKVRVMTALPLSSKVTVVSLTKLSVMGITFGAAGTEALHKPHPPAGSAPPLHRMDYMATWPSKNLHVHAHKAHASRDGGYQCGNWGLPSDPTFLSAFLPFARSLPHSHICLQGEKLSIAVTVEGS